MQILLQTDRLTLRRLTEADADNLFELNSDPVVMRFLMGGKPTPPGEIRMGFTDLAVERVFAQTMTVNEASRRVMEKAGLVLVRTFYPDWLAAVGISWLFLGPG